VLRLRLAASASPTGGRRVLVVTRGVTYGGADRLLLDVIDGLAERGWNVFCIYAAAPLVDTPDLTSTVDAHTHVALHKIAHRRNWPWFIAKYAARHRVRVVLVSNNSAGYEALPLIKRDIPDAYALDVLHTLGGAHESGGWMLFSQQYEAHLDKRIAVAQYLREHMVRELSIDSRTVTVIPNAVATPRRLPPAREIVSLQEAFIVLWAGRFSPEKRPELAIETARHVAEATDAVRFLLAGSGSLRDNVLALIHEYDLAGKVSVLSAPYRNYEAFVPYSQLMLCTSEMEGAPLVILEASACGVPTIATRVGGIPELIVDEETGYLLDDSSEFPIRAAERIVALETNRELAARLGRAAQARVKREFGRETMIDRYVEVLEGARAQGP
jgi:glycosyltransferase involved in cell wall biosynthesis